MQQQLEQEKLQQMMSTSSYSPRQRFMSPRQPRFMSPRPQFRGFGPRHEPYTIPRPGRRISTGNTDTSSAGIQRPSADGYIIKTEPSEDNNQSGSDNNAENMQSTEGSVSGIAGTSNQGTVWQDSGDSVQGDKSETQEGDPNTESATGDFDPDVSVKLEALTESELDLEITGVEPGRPAPMPIDNWGLNVSMDMNFDTTGATGSLADMSQGPSKWNLLFPLLYHSVSIQK